MHDTGICFRNEDFSDDVMRLNSAGILLDMEATYRTMYREVQSKTSLDMT